jgi:hypothetical protein
MGLDMSHHSIWRERTGKYSVLEARFSGQSVALGRSLVLLASTSLPSAYDFPIPTEAGHRHRLSLAPQGQLFKFAPEPEEHCPPGEAGERGAYKFASWRFNREVIAFFGWAIQLGSERLLRYLWRRSIGKLGFSFQMRIPPLVA